MGGKQEKKKKNKKKKHTHGKRSIRKSVVAAGEGLFLALQKGKFGGQGQVVRGEVGVGAALHILLHVLLVDRSKQRRRHHVRRRVPAMWMWPRERVRRSDWAASAAVRAALGIPDVVDNAGERGSVVAVGHLVDVRALELLVVAQADRLEKLLIVVALEVGVRRGELGVGMTDDGEKEDGRPQTHHRHAALS